MTDRLTGEDLDKITESAYTVMEINNDILMAAMKRKAHPIEAVAAAKLVYKELVDCLLNDMPEVELEANGNEKTKRQMLEASIDAMIGVCSDYRKAQDVKYGKEERTRQVDDMLRSHGVEP
jgi:hypothetical protein